jgi:hypothetical protein
MPNNVWRIEKTPLREELRAALMGVYNTDSRHKDECDFSQKYIYNTHIGSRMPFEHKLILAIERRFEAEMRKVHHVRQ